MAELKIVSLNTRGIGQYKKRKTIFNYMKRQEADICLLQETHCVKSCENIWSTQWGSDGVYANGTSEARGVAIFFQNNLRNKISDTIRDENGRFVICKLRLNLTLIIVWQTFTHLTRMSLVSLIESSIQ